jgi:hypothetical protein
MAKTAFTSILPAHVQTVALKKKSRYNGWGIRELTAEP